MITFRSIKFWGYLILAAAVAALAAFSISWFVNQNKLPETQMKVTGPQINLPSGPRNRDLVTPLKNSTRPQ